MRHASLRQAPTSFCTALGENARGQNTKAFVLPLCELEQKIPTLIKLLLQAEMCQPDCAAVAVAGWEMAALGHC